MCVCRKVFLKHQISGNIKFLHRRAAIEMELASRADQRVLRLFGHVERMVDYRMARRMLMAEVSGDGYEGDRGLAGWMV